MGFRKAVLAAAVAGGVFVTLLTEILSLFGALTPRGVALGWGMALVAVGAFLARRHRRSGAGPGLGARLARVRGLDLAMAAWMALVMALTGAIALSAVPSTYDSMTYHLARVAHWAQAGSVTFYPTHVIRQLYQPPWAEYAVLHLYLLARGDRLANLVQWGAMVASVLGVSVIARQLGAGARGQLVAAFACATIPMGVLQASTTQNDYAVALWLVCLVSSLLALDSAPGLGPTVAAGASLGLALLTKGTGYVYAAPFVIALVLAGRGRPLSRKIGQGLAIGLCALALNAPHYARNAELFRSPLGPGGEGEFRYANEALSPAILASNVIRNVGLHAGTPWTAVNAGVGRAIEAAHALMGIAVNDPRATWPTTRFEVGAPTASEDLASNGLHLLLIAVALAAALSLRAGRRVAAFAGCLVAAFALFCLALRWQPWHSRLHLPLFVLGSALVGVVLARLRPAPLVIALVAMGVSPVYAVTHSPTARLQGRRSVFRMTWAEQRERQAGPGYIGAARYVASSGCRDVGLVLGTDDREYFLWGLLADARWRGRLDHVLVDNVSARRPSAASSLEPCAIVREEFGPTAPGLRLGSRTYEPAWSHGEVQVLVPLARAATPAHPHE